MIEVHELAKHYGGTVAVDGLSFTRTPRPGHRVEAQRRRQVHHHAGKSTTMRVILIPFGR